MPGKKTYSINRRAVALLVICLLRTAVKDYQRGRLSAKNLDRLGSYFDLKRLSKHIPRKVKSFYSIDGLM